MPLDYQQHSLVLPSLAFQTLVNIILEHDFMLYSVKMRLQCVRFCISMFSIIGITCLLLLLVVVVV